jgi:RNA polymerase sigma-B factor
MRADVNERDAMIRRYLPLARHCARRYQRGHEPLEDLEQVASLALIRAVDGFDGGRGTAFSSYAVPCMVGAIKRHFRDSGWAIHVPRDLKDLALRLERLANDAPLPPTAAELANLAGVSAEAVVEAREIYRVMLTESLDRPRVRADDGDSLSVLDSLGEEDAGIDRACDSATLDAMLTELDDRDQLLVTLYYRRGQTQAQIGERLGYSQMHISRLLRRAVDRLKLSVAA